MPRWIEEPPLAAILAAAAAYGALVFGSGWHWLRWACLPCLLFPAWEDALTGVLSDGWALLLALTGLTASLHAGRLPAGLLAAAVMVILLAAARYATKGGVGTGDILLAGAAALWLTPLSALTALWLSALSALLYVGAARLTGRERRGVRFAPFWALGGGLAYAWQQGALPAWLPPL